MIGPLLFATFFQILKTKSEVEDHTALQFSTIFGRQKVRWVAELQTSLQVGAKLDIFAERNKILLRGQRSSQSAFPTLASSP